MSATSSSRFLALAGQGQFASGTESHASSDAQETASHRPGRLELQAVLAHAQARKGVTAQAAVDEAPVIGLGLPAELFPLALRGNVDPAESTSASPTSSYPCTPAVTSKRDTWPIDGDEADLSLPSTPLNTPVKHMYNAGQTPERPSLFAMPAYSQDGRALVGLGITLDSPGEPEPVIAQGAFPGPRLAPRRILEDIAADPIVTPGELRARNFPLTPGAPLRGTAMPGQSGRYFPLTPGLPLHISATPRSEAPASNFHRTPGAPLYRQPSQALFESLLEGWGASVPMARVFSMSGEEDQLKPLPTPIELVEVLVF